MSRFRVRSLRTQLALLGAAAVLIPLFILLVVVGLTASSEEVSAVDPTEEGTGPPGVDVSSSAGVPTEVLVAAALLAGSALGAVWWWSGRAVQPMESITAVADEIQAGSLDRRIAIEGAAAEVQALADSFDHMLDRLAVASVTQRELIEDASHELRTPLAALAVNNEVILNAPEPSTEDYRLHAERSEALIGRLQTTIDDLLVGARARRSEARQVDNDLMEIVRRVAEEHSVAHPEGMVHVRGPDELRMGIDGPSISRALTNLVDNAARYSPDGQPVEVDVEIDARGTVSLSVSDHGPGIDAVDLPRVFDRYYASSDGGSGIGLALVKQVAEAHGDIEVVSPLPGETHGTRFVITFTSGGRGRRDDGGQ